jgi:DNA-binding MarR family transcriptional regulator
MQRDEIPPLGEVLDFMRVLWGLDHQLQRASKRMEQAIGVTGPQRLVIRIVGRFPGITPGHLARLLQLHPSTLTGVLKRLEGHGLLRKRADRRDRRRAFLGLTEKGRRIDERLSGTVEAGLQQVIAKTPPRTMRAARSVLLSICDALVAGDEGSLSHRGN